MIKTLKNKDIDMVITRIIKLIDDENFQIIDLVCNTFNKESLIGLANVLCNSKHGFNNYTKRKLAYVIISEIYENHSPLKNHPDFIDRLNVIVSKYGI